jgi:hypothetical protein
MASRDGSADAALRCDHCARPVRETVHTRTSYRVDYYTLHSGHGEWCTVAGDDRQHAFTYVRLVDRFDVITCSDCYRKAAIQHERNQQFHPEREPHDLAREEV